ncbi:MAG: hypothetical protein O2884_13860 [Chloroflexi bacterium]|nr:hypothetical protein [Chloroflexota bacterium]
MIVRSSIQIGERELCFVRNVAEGLAPTRAASEAGYSVGHTAALLRKPVVQAALLAFHENTGAMLEIANSAGDGQ